MKKILVILVAFILIAGGGLYYVYSNIGSIIKDVVETHGNKVIGVPVGLANVNTDKLISGDISLSSLKIGVPSNFKSDYTFLLDKASVKVDLESLKDGDVLIIDEIIVNSPKIIYEYLDGTSNIATIQESVNNFVNSLSSNDSKTDNATNKEEISKEENAKKVIIKKLLITDGNVSVRAAILDKAIGSDMPDLLLTDIGKKENGVLIKDAVSQIMTALSTQISGVVGNMGLGSISDLALQTFGKGSDLLKGLNLNTGGIVKSLKSSSGTKIKEVKTKIANKINDAIGTGDNKAVNDAVDKATGKIGDLLQGVLGN